MLLANRFGFLRMLGINRQRGYATVLTPLLAGALMLSLFSLYDVGQINSHKMRGQNTADAGAYTVALVMARDMNFQASTNRAMVVNQVTIGQMVGLVSYTAMVKESAVNIGYIVDILTFFGIGAVLQPYVNALETYSETIYDVLHDASEIIIPIIEIVQEIITNSQLVFHNMILADGLTMYNQVIKDNDPDVNLSGVIGAGALAKLTKEYLDTVERFEEPKTNNSNSNDKTLKRYDEFANVIHQSSDEFLTDRTHRLFLPGLEQRGASEFKRREVNNKYVWEWTSLDTLDVEIGKTFFGCLFCAPLGWGAAHALNENDNSDTFDYDEGRDDRGQRWGNAVQSRAYSLAKSEYEDNNLAETYSLRPFYDLVSDGLLDRGPAMLSVVYKSANKTRVWQQVAGDIPGYKLQSEMDVAEKGNLPNDNLVSMGSAEPYFARAIDLFARDDNKVELGNMYNPFWQARLTKISRAAYAAVAAEATGLSL